MDSSGKILVKHHLGMGDGIVHNGMIRKITEENPHSLIFTAAKPVNFKNTEYMFRDNPRIKVISVEGDGDLHHLEQTNKFDKVISSHFGDGNNPFDYEIYFDDAFYKKVGMDPKIKNEYFYVERDVELENKVFDELITSKGITEYIFVHEKKKLGVVINRDKLEPNLPIVTADVKYGIFQLLKVIEMAKSVNLISSSFLSLMTCKKYNQNTFAHMYCDRIELSPYIQQQNIVVLT
jgi:hypothetical protein